MEKVKPEELIPYTKEAKENEQRMKTHKKEKR